MELGDDYYFSGNIRLTGNAILWVSGKFVLVLISLTDA